LDNGHTGDDTVIAVIPSPYGQPALQA